MTDTRSGPVSEGRKTYPGAAVLIFVIATLVGTLLLNGGGVIVALLAIPVAVGTWRWGIAGFVGGLVAAGLIFGGCLAIIFSAIE